MQSFKQAFKKDIAFLSSITRIYSKDMANAINKASVIAQNIGDVQLAILLDKANRKFEEFLDALKEVEQYANR